MTSKLTSEKLVKQAAKIALDKKGSDIVILDLRKVTDITDFFLILSANNNRQLVTIEQEIVRKLKKERKSPPVEGNKDWVLIDYGDIIIHIFTADTRQYYQIERLWKDAKKQMVNGRI